MRLSFKKSEKPKGLSAIGASPRSTSIKIDGKDVGKIVFDGKSWSSPGWEVKSEKWMVRLIVDDEKTGNWKWIGLKSRFETDEKAIAFIKTRINDIMKVFKLHPIDM